MLNEMAQVAAQRRKPSLGQKKRWDLVGLELRPRSLKKCSRQLDGDNSRFCKDAVHTAIVCGDFLQLKQKYSAAPLPPK